MLGLCEWVGCSIGGSNCILVFKVHYSRTRKKWVICMYVNIDNKKLCSLQLFVIFVINVPHLGKGKGHPRTGHEGPEEEKMYSSILSLTSVLHRGRWLAPRPGRFTPTSDPVPIVQEARWAPGPGLNECGKSRPRRDSIPALPSS
jgi:hypothetical protein